MKREKYFILVCLLVIIPLVFCDKSTDPEWNGVEAAIEAMLTIEEQMTDLEESNGYTSVQEMPDMVFGASSMLKGIDPSRLASLKMNDGIDPFSDLFLLYFYLFLDHRIYINDGVGWFVSDTLDNAIHFIFPYESPETGRTHRAEWHYYDMAYDDVSLTVRYDVFVDFTQFVGVTISLTGTGFSNIQQGIMPHVTAIDMAGFVRDNNDVLYDFHMTIEETLFTMSAAIQGQSPVITTLTGEFQLNPDSNQQSTLTKPKTPAPAFAMQVTFNEFTLNWYPDNEASGSGNIGQIMLNGTVMGFLSIVQGERYVYWFDGRVEPFSVYFPDQSWFDYIVTLQGGSGAIG